MSTARNALVGMCQRHQVDSRRYDFDDAVPRRLRSTGNGLKLCRFPRTLYLYEVG